MVRIYSLGWSGFFPPFFPPLGFAGAGFAGISSPSSSVNCTMITRGWGKDLDAMILDEWSWATAFFMPAFAQSGVSSASWKMRLLMRFTETSGLILTSYSNNGPFGTFTGKKLVRSLIAVPVVPNPGRRGRSLS